MNVENNLSQQTPLQSPLHDKHLALEAKMGHDAHWELPLSYGDVLAEAAIVRRRAGVIDVSHMGRFRIRGAGALDLLHELCTIDVVHQEDDTAQATLMCNPRGGIIDLCTLLRLEDGWMLTTSPGNGQKVRDHLDEHTDHREVRVDDLTFKTVQIAVEGPQAPQLLDKVLPFKVSTMLPGQVHSGSMLLAKYTAMRVSLGNLWGLQVILPNLLAGRAWDFITRKAGDHAIAPVGMGAMDVLRIEAGRAKYGHEINETIDPFTAGLEGLLDFGHSFLGATALADLRHRAPSRKRVGLKLTPPDALLGSDAAEVCEADLPLGLKTIIPRQGTALLDAEGTEVGTITSGTYSPAAGGLIAMAYVAPAVATPGTVLHANYSGQKQTATVTTLPFIT